VYVAVCCSVLQMIWQAFDMLVCSMCRCKCVCVAVSCSVLQCVAVRCSVRYAGVHVCERERARGRVCEPIYERNNNQIYSQLQIGRHSILRLFLKNSDVPEFC